MTSLPQRQAASTRPKAPARHGRPLTDEQRDILRDVWTFLVASASDGQGITATFKLHNFALRLCFPRAGKFSSTKPAAYQRYAHEPQLRPWATAGERELVFVALSAMRWESDAGAWMLKRPIGEFAQQIGCGRTRINDAINAQRGSAFPVLAVESTPAFDRGGEKHRGALRFALVRDPLKFAEARDKSRAARQTAEDERRKALHIEIVRLQIARERGEITAREFAHRKALITHRITWGSPAPLVAVEPIGEVAPDVVTVPAPVRLKGKALREAFASIEAVYPKAATDEADGRYRARDAWELLQPTTELTDAIRADVQRRTAVARSSDTPDGWRGLEACWVPDLFTYIRDERWKDEH